MKKGKWIAAALCLACGIGAVGVKLQSTTNLAHAEYVQSVAADEHLQIQAKSAYLAEYGTGSVMYAKNEMQHLPIASMCKIMTLILCFDAINDGVMTYDDEIMVSERAASMGGSQVFLESNAKYPVKELMKSIVVCSANDSCVALAEKIAGSESIFVDKMNERAKSLGANDTLFANCTGLPKEPQYSCAKDVAIMLKELLKNEKYYDFGKVWLDKFQHPEGRFTEITNTNKLVRYYDGCDGGKTGFTNQAGFCLGATAKRGEMRVISVVIGEENSKNRFDDTRTLFDYAFANYTLTPIIHANECMEEYAKVKGGKQEKVAVYPMRSVYAFAKRGEHTDVKTEVSFYKMNAPVAKGKQVGELIVYTNGVESDKIPLLANENVEKANVLDKLKDIGKAWCDRK